MNIVVPERGARTLSREQWLLVSADPGFQDLVSRAVLSARPSRHAAAWELTARGYVGRVVLGGNVVEIAEKFSGALNAMMQVVVPRAFKLARASSPVVHDKSPQALFAEMLVAAVRSYMSGYSLQTYRDEHSSGAYLTGRLSVSRTVGFRARGVRHRVAFTRTIFTDDLPANRIIFRALGEVIAAGAADAIGGDLAASARALRAAFGASAVSAQSMTKLEVLTEAAAEGSIEGRHAAIRDAVALSLAILQGAGTSDGMRVDAIVPRSWFVNLERLFEQMLLRLIAEALLGSAEVSGPARGMPLFAAPIERYPANPDVLIRGQGWIAVVDAKYKDQEGAPDASDVYQLLAHAAACGADKAALFYPSETDRPATQLGRSATGCTTWAFALNLGDPRKSILTALSDMMLLAPTGR